MDATHQGVPVTSSSSSGSRPRILAVDDQPDSLKLLQIRLKAAQMDCVAFTNGPAALHYLEDHSVDVIILDVMMPQMDGFAICRAIKSKERTQDIPVLFLTARNEAADKVRGLEVGGHDYLGKPVEQQELLARTRAALRVKQLHDQLKQQLHWEQEANQLHHEMLDQHWQKTLGLLAGSLAHEINNPLAAALGSVQLLADDQAMPEAMRQRLEVVSQSLQRAGQKLRSLLLIAQASRQPVTTALHQLVADLVTLTNFQMVINKIELTSTLDPACHWTGQVGELAQAVLYILNNAIEAVCGRSHPKIDLELVQQDNEFHIRILDNGGGIPPDVASRMFDPFFTTKPPPHHGAGLFLAQKIIREAGGRIDFESNPEAGQTLFTVCLPASVPGLTGA